MKRCSAHRWSRGVEEQPGQRLILAVEHLQGHDFIGWDNRREAEEKREDAAELGVTLDESPVSRTVRRCHYRTDAIPAGIRRRRGGKHLELHDPASGGVVEPALDHERTAYQQRCRQP
jgi:hypothetical protein